MLHFRSRFPWSDLNPEFLREGSAVKDFMQPSLVVVGSHDPLAAQRVASLYASLPVEISVVALRTAELIKYACNGFHALKIAFANEIGTIATALGLEGDEVMRTVCHDTKLRHYSDSRRHPVGGCR